MRYRDVCRVFIVCVDSAFCRRRTDPDWPSRTAAPCPGEHDARVGHVHRVVVRLRAGRLLEPRQPARGHPQRESPGHDQRPEPTGGQTNRSGVAATRRGELVPPGIQGREDSNVRRAGHGRSPKEEWPFNFSFRKDCRNPAIGTGSSSGLRRHADGFPLQCRLHWWN